LAGIGVTDFAQWRRQFRWFAVGTFGTSEIWLTGVRDRAPAAAAGGAMIPTASPNSREYDNASALAGARRRPLGAAVAQPRAFGEYKAATTRRTSTVVHH